MVTILESEPWTGETRSQWCRSFTQSVWNGLYTTDVTCQVLNGLTENPMRSGGKDVGVGIGTGKGFGSSGMGAINKVSLTMLQVYRESPVTQVIKVKCLAL